MLLSATSQTHRGESERECVDRCCSIDAAAARVYGQTVHRQTERTTTTRTTFALFFSFSFLLLASLASRLCVYVSITSFCRAAVPGKKDACELSRKWPVITIHLAPLNTNLSIFLPQSLCVCLCCVRFDSLTSPPLFERCAAFCTVWQSALSPADAAQRHQRALFLLSGDGGDCNSIASQTFFHFVETIHGKRERERQR